MTVAYSGLTQGGSSGGSEVVYVEQVKACLCLEMEFLGCGGKVNKGGSNRWVHSFGLFQGWVLQRHVC